VAVNVSSRQLTATPFAEELIELLETTGAVADRFGDRDHRTHVDARQPAVRRSPVGVARPGRAVRGG